jgi:uncharacterized protein YjiS (DUF1127 family)
MKQRSDAEQGTRRLLALNDSLLRDAGMNRADLEYEALCWPFCPASSRTFGDHR